jgi:hypothetical protein
MEAFFPQRSVPQPSPTPSVTLGTGPEIPRAQLTMGAFRKAFPNGIGSLFYALLITSTIYKFMTNIKSSQRLDFKLYLPVTESLLFVIPGFMSCCTTKWNCPLSPWRALAGDLKHATETEAQSGLDAGNAHLWPLVLDAPLFQSPGLGSPERREDHSGSDKFSPRSELF